MLRLFKLRFRNDDGFWVGHWVVFARTTVADNSGKLDPVSQFAPSNRGATYQVFSVGNILGCAHVMPEKLLPERE